MLKTAKIIRFPQLEHVEIFSRSSEFERQLQWNAIYGSEEWRCFQEDQHIDSSCAPIGNRQCWRQQKIITLLQLEHVEMFSRSSEFERQLQWNAICSFEVWGCAHEDSTLTAVGLQLEIEDVQDSRRWLESHFANPAAHLDSLYNDGGGRGWEVTVND